MHNLVKVGTMHRGEEDYIKCIYKLQFQGDKAFKFVSNSQVADYLGHAPQTVNEMVKKLSQKNFLTYTPYKGTRLTEAGKQIAIDLIRAHRLWEFFLVNELGFDLDEVHDLAESLEHATTVKLEQKLYCYLGNPDVCPHGRRIPIRDINNERGKNETDN